MKPKHLALLAVLLAPLFVAATCSPQHPLDPVGPYQGDTVLYDLDGAIEETTAVFDMVVAWAERNAAYVAAHDNIAQQVARIRAELDGSPQPQETLTRLFAARDAYVAARTAAHTEAARKEIALARTAIDAARILLTTATP